MSTLIHTHSLILDGYDCLVRWAQNHQEALPPEAEQVFQEASTIMESLQDLWLQCLTLSHHATTMGRLATIHFLCRHMKTILPQKWYGLNLTRYFAKPYSFLTHPQAAKVILLWQDIDAMEKVCIQYGMKYLEISHRLGNL